MNHPLSPAPQHSTIMQQVIGLLHQRDGALTRELLQTPAAFGLGKVPERLVPDATTTMVCGFCSTGCGLNVHLRGGEAINLTPSTEYPVNLGMACPKGWEALNVLKAPDRATTPLIRFARGKFRPLDWDAALRIFCDKFQSIQRKHGPESVAFLSSGQIATEEMALLGSLARFGMGIAHGDSNTRQCMATSAVAYKESFGFDAPPYTYADFEESDVIVLVGANVCIAHPILWERIVRNPHSPTIVVLDPRKTETAMAATIHLPLAPKSDLVLLYAIAKLLIDRDCVDRELIARSTTGFEEFLAHVQNYPLERAVQASGLNAALIERVVDSIARGKRVSFWWTMGVNQSYEGVRTAQAIINLALLTGNIGRPGTGANSITGQCNAMGSRLFSNTTNLLGGHDFESAADRQKVAAILGIDMARVPDFKSAAYHEILKGVLEDRIKGLWIIGTNTAHSWINQNDLHEMLEHLDFLVVQDMYHTTETAQLADLILPAAGWGEKEGTLINSERRIGRIKKVARAPGEALADFSIFRLVAEYWGCGDMFRAWSSPEATFEIMKALSKGQPFDISGIRDYRMLDEVGGVQWPFPEGAKLAERNPDGAPLVDSAEFTHERRLFEDGRFYHADGRARFVFSKPTKMPEPPSAKYPFLLLTGRGTASQWHTQTRTGKSAVLRKLYPEHVYVEINPADARRLGLSPNQTVLVESQRGQLVAKTFITHTVQTGQLFIPMHYATTNRLTHAHFDPYSKQPSYKDCAVRVRPWHRGEGTE